ncbi:MAG: efflux RND transporter periplasmic adaptor subunit, partial [Candidatus Omnitrophica bacterium]|nr:efflux RND transporter periplasmic adaptor subunit [Candidatus Omnitrophota bacterium]
GRVGDTRQCYFVSHVEAKLGYPLKVDKKVRMEIECGSSTATVEGKICFVSPVVDPASNLMKVKVLFDNPEGKIRPGVAGKLFLEAPADVR